MVYAEEEAVAAAAATGMRVPCYVRVRTTPCFLPVLRLRPAGLRLPRRRRVQ